MNALLRTVTGIAAAAILLTACSVTIGDPAAEPTAASPSVPVSPREPAPSDGDAAAEPAPISAPGRLAVITADGVLYTVQPDGSGRAEMRVGDGPALQPSWSPDGNRLAWVVQRTTDTGVGGAIAVAGPRGQGPTLTTAPFLPYYLSWSPDGGSVAFLGAGSDPDAQVRMGVLDLTGPTPKITSVADGDPFFYFAWSPDGRRVLAHAGEDRLETVGLDGARAAVSRRPGLFSAPAWSADGRTIVYAERGASGLQQLLAVVDGEEPRVLVEGAGALSFVMRPDGGAVAYQLLDEANSDLFDRRPTLPGDGVRVVDIDSGVTRRATSIRAVTFWWSPDGERLLVHAPQPESTGPIPFLWQVWDGGGPAGTGQPHAPTIEVLRDYAPFFPQYAQSTTPWAPDGSAYAFPAVDAEGRGHVVVHEVGGDTAAIGEGVYVTWSP